MPPFPADRPVPANVKLSVTTKPARVFRGLETVQAKAVPGATPRDHGGRIGVKPDGTAAGCEVLAATVTYTTRNE